MVFANVHDGYHTSGLVPLSVPLPHRESALVNFCLCTRDIAVGLPVNACFSSGSLGQPQLSATCGSCVAVSMQHGTAAATWGSQVIWTLSGGGV